MYPASSFGVRSTPQASTARLLSLAAALVLFFGWMTALAGMRPGTGHFVGASGISARVCPELERDGLRNGMIHLDCRFVPADPRIPQRIAVATGTLSTAGALFVAAARTGRRRDSAEDQLELEPAGSA